MRQFYYYTLLLFHVKRFYLSHQGSVLWHLAVTLATGTSLRHGSEVFNSTEALHSICISIQFRFQVFSVR